MLYVASFRHSPQSSAGSSRSTFPRERTANVILADPTTCPRQSNSASDSSVISFPATNSIHGFGRPAPLCRNLRGAPVHYEQHVARPSLLHVRLLVLMLRHHDPHLRRSDCTHGLFPTLQRELPLAMESIYSGGGLGWLCVCICTHLLDYSYQLQQLHFGRAVYWI